MGLQKLLFQMLGKQIDMSNSNARFIAALAIYIAGKKLGIYITMNEVANAADTYTEVISQNYEKLQRNLMCTHGCASGNQKIPS